jgi:hypothetical protein
MKSGHTETVRTQAHSLRKFRHRFLFIVIPATVLPLLLSGCAGVLSKSATQTATALFQVNPASVSFGKITIGKQATQTVTVSNVGTVALNITQASISNAQFSVSGTNFPLALAAGQSSALSVNVTPTAAANLSGMLTLTGDGGSSPVAVSLSATAVSGTQPQLSLNSASINFGTVSTGQKGIANLTFSNLGSADLTVSVISMTGSAFGITGITTPKTISAGQSVQAAISFSPTTAGSASGSISITSNDPSHPAVTVTLEGTGSTTATGQLTANPVSLSFGTVGTGTSTTKQITLTNSGNAAVKISSVSAAGTGFAISGLTMPTTLNASQSATLTAKFDPTTSGSHTGSVTVASDASNSFLTIALSGTAAQPGLSVSPTSFNFGSVVDGQTKSQAFTLTNTGTATLTLAQITESGAGFSISGLSTPASLSAGQSATFSVLFAPTTTGALSGSVSISSNAANSPTAVALSGSGVAGTVTISATPSSLSFSAVNVGSTSSKSVSIANTGNVNLTISQFSVTGKDFSASGITTPLTLGAGHSATLSVAFKPLSSEQVSGNVTVTTSQGASDVIAVSGTGVQAGLTVTPSSVSFGSVPTGSSNSQTIQLSNSGTAALSISQVSVTGTGYSISTLALPVSLNPGQSTTFNAKFAPTSAGSTTGSISVMSSAPGSPATISLSGSGVTSTQTLSFSSTSLNFGSLNTGLTSTKVVTVTNTGNANVTISAITASGTGFSLGGASTPVTLTPTQTLTFSVIFSPAAAGSDSGSVTVTSNASGSPAVIVLSGSGVQASTSHTVTLNWNASSATVAGYNVYRSTNSGTGYAKIGSLIGSLSYTDSTVQNATTYYYVTTAVDSSGTESSYSNEAVAVIP